VRIRANRFNFTGTSINSGTGAFELGPTSAGRPIRLGADSGKAAATTANDSLYVSTGELAKITSQFLRIGAANAGPITLETPIVKTTAGSNTLKLTSASSVSNSVSGLVSPLNVTNLAVEAGGAISLSSNSSATDNKLALNSTSSASGAVQYSQLDGEFTPETVDGVDAVYGIAAGVRASNVPTSQKATVYQNATLSPNPTVQVVDAYGQPLYSNNTLSSGYKVTVSSNSGDLSGTTQQNLVSGAGSFTDLKFEGTGAAIPLTFALAPISSAPITGTPQAVTGDYEVLQSTPSALSVSWPGAVAKAGATFSTPAVVSLRDAGNNVINAPPYSTALITATIAGPGGQILAGSSVQAVDGVATFTNLAIA
jgi:hypothetical protein